MSQFRDQSDMYTLKQLQRWIAAHPGLGVGKLEASIKLAGSTQYGVPGSGCLKWKLIVLEHMGAVVKRNELWYATEMML